MRGELAVLNDGSVHFSYDTKPKSTRSSIRDSPKSYYYEFKNVISPELVLFLLDNLMDEELCDVIDACSKRLRRKFQPESK